MRVVTLTLVVTVEDDVTDQEILDAAHESLMVDGPFVDLAESSDLQIKEQA